MSNGYSLICPKNITSLSVFNSPHSGCNFLPEFLEQINLNLLEVRSSEDAYVDDLFAASVDNGSFLLKANFSRAYVDVNREISELDPLLIKDLCNNKVQSKKVLAGLGVLPRVVGNGKTIFREKISMRHAQERLDSFYLPYHRKLSILLKEIVGKFGSVILFDCHSMPHNAIKDVKVDEQGFPEIVLGNRFGSSCSSRVFEIVYQIFNSEGFRVSRNIPFAGGFITENYGEPQNNVHAIQIELDRSLYMNEDNLNKKKDYEKFKFRLKKVISRLTKIQIPENCDKLAAE